MGHKAHLSTENRWLISEDWRYAGLFLSEFPPSQEGLGDLNFCKEVSMKFQPLNDRLLVKRAPHEEKTQGGIIIPETAKEAPAVGTVVAAGPGAVSEAGALRELTVKAGDTVYFRKYAGSEVTVAGEEHIIMREDEVLAIQA